MSKVADAANKIVELPPVPSRQYSTNCFYRDIVLRWLAATGTLRKEFERNKLGNIRLRAFPVED